MAKEKTYCATFIVETRPTPMRLEMEFYADSIGLARDHARDVARDYKLRVATVRRIPMYPALVWRAGSFYDTCGNKVDLNSRR